LRIRVMEKVMIECGNKTIWHHCEVMKLSEGIDMLLGHDVITKLGIAISGLPIGHKLAERLPEPVADEVPMLRPLGMPEAEKTAEFIEVKDSFMKAIAEVVEENQKMSPNSFCTLPESVVYLNTPEGKYAYRRQYPIPVAMEALVDEAVESWKAEGIIIPALREMHFNSPLVLVPKKDVNGNKTLRRPCLDMRLLNQLLEEDNFTLLLIRDIFVKLKGAVIFSVIDLKKAYHQFMIYPPHRHKMAFTWGAMQWMFTGAPFGIKTLSSQFQCIMGILLGDLWFALIFVDDIIIFSYCQDDHEIHVNTVVRRLTKASLIINADKCHFFCMEVILLGFIIN